VVHLNSLSILSVLNLIVGSNSLKVQTKNDLLRLLFIWVSDITVFYLVNCLR
jgi:hypothetical protein